MYIMINEKTRETFETTNFRLLYEIARAEVREAAHKGKTADFAIRRVSDNDLIASYRTNLFTGRPSFHVPARWY